MQLSQPIFSHRCAMWSFCGTLCFWIIFTSHVNCEVEIEISNANVNFYHGKIQHSLTSTPAKNDSCPPPPTSPCEEAWNILENCMKGIHSLGACVRAARDHLDICYPEYRWFIKVNPKYPGDLPYYHCDIACGGNLFVHPNINVFIVGQMSRCPDDHVLPAIPEVYCYTGDLCDFMRPFGACSCAKVKTPVWAAWSSNRCTRYRKCDGFYLYSFK